MQSERAAVVPEQGIADLIDEGAIAAPSPIPKGNIQPASLDLRLGERAWRMQASFLPGRRGTVAAGIGGLAMSEMDLRERHILERNCVYLVELAERLRLPATHHGKANPKSTTGRLDIFTRLVTDRSNAFDEVSAGYEGRLYAEIIPRTFPIIAENGQSISQLRLIDGKGDATLDDAELAELDAGESLVERTGEVAGADIGRGVRVSVRLRDAEGEPVAYQGRDNTPAVRLGGRHPVDRYWARIGQPSDGRIVLNPGEFYVLGSVEGIRVPPGHAAEMVPFDPSVGELRVHYAGFFDPGFGWHPDHGRGTRAVLEVRAHDTPFVLEHGQIVGRLEYSRMRERPRKLYGHAIGSSYHDQRLALSKQFRNDD